MSNYQPTPHTTATQPPPVVLADAGTHPSPRFSRAHPPAVKTWAGIHPRTPTSMSFRAQRSGAGESCCRINPSPIGATLMIARPNGFTQPFPSLHTSSPHPPVIPAPPSVVPAKAANPSLLQSTCPRRGGSRTTRPLPLPCPRGCGDPSLSPFFPRTSSCRKDVGRHPSPYPYQHVIPSAAKRCRGILLSNQPFPRRGDPCGRPS